MHSRDSHFGSTETQIGARRKYIIRRYTSVYRFFVVPKNRTKKFHKNGIRSCLRINCTLRQKIMRQVYHERCRTNILLQPRQICRRYAEY